jgi:parvulin-like peptidyl-prolyl isomerase
VFESAVPPGSPAIRRTSEQVLERARLAREKLGAGSAFAQVAAELSDALNARQGGILGTFGPGMLPAELDAFLFAAEPGALSGVLKTEHGACVLQRIDTHAAVLALRVDAGAAEDELARERVTRLRAELLAGADFTAVARERSDDRESAARGGQFAIFERGTQDVLLKSAAFELALGQVSEPIRSPLGWHLLKRVELGAVDPSLAENNWVRLRCVLLRYVSAQGAGDVLRTKADTKTLGETLLARLQRGEDFAAIAREHDDDTGGRERAGNLGWVHRATPDLAAPLRQAFLMKPREIVLRDTPLGYLIVQRER